MEEERSINFTISDLIQRARPLTAASSLDTSRPISTSDNHRSSRQNRRRKTSVASCESPSPQTLKPLNHPNAIIGTITLPAFGNSDSAIKCSCFQFSDDSATVCCDILDFDPNVIGRKVRILAWNFIPIKCGDRGAKGGFLEIIRSEFVHASVENVCSLSGFSSFCLALGACDVKDNSSSRYLVFGVIESVSPLFVVPCAIAESGLRNISGFLVEVLVCQCKFCVSKFLASDLKDLSKKNVEDHKFIRTVIVYFCGLTSSWHPVITQSIGEVVLLRGLKKKLVFIRKERSQLMYVTTDEASLHISKLFKNRCLIRNTDIRGKGECGCYTGVITGVYMQGMVVEFDQHVILLLTDQHLTVPHCVRVGAIVAVKNVHFVDPKFPWAKMLVLGACCRTSMHLVSFSPLQTGCHLRSYSQSCLQKFINSLPFAARLWALLVVSCFRKKFAGFMSEKEILGSKHKEGLAQKYASFYLQPSAFQDRQGVLVEFCKHEMCSIGKEGQYGHLRLVLPIANLISYCENSWKKSLDDMENLSTFVDCINKKKPLSCCGRSYVQTTRRVFKTDEIGILAMGTLKMSLSFGRLQLVDATAGIDIKLDLPATWDSDRVFEAKGFTLVMEGMPPKLVNLDSTIYEPVSCRSIFSIIPPLRRMTASVYLYQHPSDEDYRSCSLFFDWKGNPPEPDSGKFHLIMLTHKFPTLQKFRGDLAKRSNIFAQAVVLPLDLLISGKHDDAFMTSEYWKDSLEDITAPELNHTQKRCKIELDSVEGSNYGLHELPCLIATKGLSSRRSCFLHCTNEYAKIVSRSKSITRVLLEFNPSSFCMYEVMTIGSCYLVKHHEEDKLCSIKVNHQVSHVKLPVNSATHLWSLAFSSIETLQSSEDSNKYSDINVFVPPNALKLLEDVIEIMDGGRTEPRDSSEKESDPHRSMINASMQSVGASSSNYPLPEGNLVTLHGLIVAFHDSNGDASLAQPRPTRDEGHLPIFLQGNNGICVHLLVNNQIVKIFCNVSKQTFAIGFGRDVYATFHRILVLCGQNKHVMTPVSFITISDKSLTDGHLIHESNHAPENAGLLGVASPNTFPAAVISDALELSEVKPMQFRCRVVAVYTLVVEKDIPFAGFIMDDGSSSCCCWMDSGRAAMLLGFEFEEYSAESFRRSDDLQCSSTIGQLNRIVDEHGRVVVKNYGSLYDPSCQDLIFCVDSERLISISDEDFLQNLIANAFRCTSWSIVGSVMDQKTSRWLEERLTEVGMEILPLLNVWATSVGYADVLAEARNIIQEFV